MRKLFALGSLALFGAGLWACSEAGPTTPIPPADHPMSLDDSPCFTPTQTALAVDSVAIFFPTGDCGTPGKRRGTLTWDNPQTPVRAGLDVDPTCSKQVHYHTGVWKVTRCAPGTVTLTVYTDSAGSTVLQTIEITDPDTLP